MFRIASAVFFNQGQVCCAGSRVFVEASVYDIVVAGIAEIAKNTKLGNGLDTTSEMVCIYIYMCTCLIFYDHR